MWHNHRIVTAKIDLSLRKNTTLTTKTTYYDWSLLNNIVINDNYTITRKQIRYFSGDILNTLSEWRNWGFRPCPYRSCSSRMYTKQWEKYGAYQKLVDKFTSLGTSVSSTENDITTRIGKAWTIINSQIYRIK